MQNLSSVTLTLPENLQSSASEAIGVASDSPSSSTHDLGNKVISDDLSKVANTSLPLPVNELGQSTIRTFTPLFDDDDDDDNEHLFGHRSPKHQGALDPSSGQLGTASSSDMTLPIMLGQGRIVETASSSTAQDVHTQLPPVSSPASDVQLPSQSTLVENRTGERASEKPSSSIASLLFGDDEDDEDALFGPLGGRTSRASKSGKAGSIFGD